MKSAPGLLTVFSLPLTDFPGYIMLDVPGGTENVAATKMTKTLAVNAPTGDETGESETGDGNTPSASKPTKETNGARSEGTRKSLEAMFDSMAPVKKGKKAKRRDDDDGSSDDGENKRRRGGGRGGGGGGPNGEAGFCLIFLKHVWCAVALPENQI